MTVLQDVVREKNPELATYNDDKFAKLMFESCQSLQQHAVRCVDNANRYKHDKKGYSSAARGCSVLP